MCRKVGRPTNRLLCPGALQIASETRSWHPTFAATLLVHVPHRGKPPKDMHKCHYLCVQDFADYVLPSLLPVFTSASGQALFQLTRFSDMLYQLMQPQHVEEVLIPLLSRAADHGASLYPPLPFSLRGLPLLWSCMPRKCCYLLLCHQIYMCCLFVRCDGKLALHACQLSWSCFTRNTGIDVETSAQ